MSRRNIVRLCLAWLPIAAAVACDQAADRLTAPVPRQSQPDVAASVIHVADVEQLYDAINADPPNGGAAIILASGTYVLSAKDPNGEDRPNLGRLELQLDMSLYGVTDDRSAVVIDGSGLPSSSFVVSFGRTAVIRIGLGSNTVEWLTVLGNENAAAGIATELPGTANTRIRVAHVVSGGSSRGVDVRNVGAINSARRIDAEIVDNELFGPDEVAPNTMTEGIRIANFVNANRGVIVATLSGNRAHGFQLGCIIANNQSSNAALQVRSSDDRFFDNTLGCLIAGGLSQSARVANSNTTVFKAYGSHFVDNTASIPGIDPGGIRVVGGLATTQPDVTSGNTVSVELWGSKVSDNTPPDFVAFGARHEALPPPGFAGTNNHVTITLNGVSKQIDVQPTASSPSEPAGTNTVTIIR